MMLVGNAARIKGISYTNPAQMRVSWGVWGPAARRAILLLMVNAALLGTTAISLSSSWAWGEVGVVPHSLNLKLKEAPGFYGFYIAAVAAAAGIVLIPRAPLQLIILGVQVLAGIMLPSAIIFLNLLLNDKSCWGRSSSTSAGTTPSTGPSSVSSSGFLTLAVQVVLPNVLKAESIPERRNHYAFFGSSRSLAPLLGGPSLQ